MPVLQKPDEWCLKEIDTFESAGWEALRAVTNTLIVAGPGAGKTELLAQRACYLLETGLCPSPKRILALSFKRDARTNLQDRVKRRCGDELAKRFDSDTFDGFAKHLLDSFLLALPIIWQPTVDYNIVNSNNDSQKREFIRNLTPVDGVTIRDIEGISLREFDRAFVQFRFSSSNPNPQDLAIWAAWQLWKQLLCENQQSQLTFLMIERLAEFMLSQNPKVVRALRATYSHVFLDEFQDTTWAQYTLLKTSFHGSAAILTAVGDNKQRIMLWAGALDDIFAQYQSDFTAEKKELLCNYRSSDTLVWLQQRLIGLIEPDRTLTNTPAPLDIGEACRILTFETHDDEAAIIAEIIETALTQDGLSPRDICVLTRQKIDEYAEHLLVELSSRGIQGRVETKLQDILSEPLTDILVLTLELALPNTRGDAWCETVSILRNLRELDENDIKVQALEESLGRFVAKLSRKFREGHIVQKEHLLHMLQQIIDFFGVDELKWKFSQYLQGTYFTDLLNDCVNALWSSYEETDDWANALQHFKGDDSIPMMTIHKSKGLEFHTVIFLGLEDSALWNFNNQTLEEKCAFFVALSRAKTRVIFTFAKQRTTGGAYGGAYKTQRRQNIGVLYETLRTAGVPEIPS